MGDIVLSGIPGLDPLLHGGFPANAQIVLEGSPGTGKTTLGMQFLVYGATTLNEPGLYITFEELPAAIYRSMESFGWNIRELERDNLLKVVCISPNAFVDQLMQEGGVLERLIHRMGCRRIVIDSVSLYKHLTDEGPVFRQRVYMLTNILRKFSITSLLISETGTSFGMESPIENYVADGVIRLSVKPFMNDFRTRIVEIVKMRNRKIIEGEHTYRITDSGIYIVPSISYDDPATRGDMQLLSTGIDLLDEALGGGIPRGSIFAIDTNSRVQYKPMIISLLSAHLARGNPCLVQLSSMTSVGQFAQYMQLFDISALDMLRAGQLHLIDYFNRPISDELRPWVTILNPDSASLLRSIDEATGAFVAETMPVNPNVLLKFDLYTAYIEQGQQFATQLFKQELHRALEYNLTYVMLCNFAEMSDESASFLKRNCSGIIRTWIEGVYQYVQVTKSPLGHISPPMLVESVMHKPFIRLL